MRRAWLLPAAGLLLTVLIAGCDDRKSEADAIASAIRAMPGMSYVDVEYQCCGDNKPSFKLYVTVEAASTAQQVSDAGRTFVHRVDAVGFREHDVGLGFSKDTDCGPADSVCPDSTLTFFLTSDGKRTTLGADDVAGTAARWVDIWKFPGVKAVQMTQTWAGPPGSGSITVAVIDDAAGAAFARQFPEFEKDWCVYQPRTESSLCK